MGVDVLTETIIDRPIAEVAQYVCDPSNAPEWYDNIESVEWVTDPPVAVGSQMAFVAHFLGRELRYTYEVLELTPGEKMVMSTSQGPFPMETSYVFSEAEGGTLMQLRNRGAPAGFSKLMAPLMVGAMRKANTKDLAKLKSILESR